MVTHHFLFAVVTKTVHIGERREGRTDSLERPLSALTTKLLSGMLLIRTAVSVRLPSFITSAAIALAILMAGSLASGCAVSVSPDREGRDKSQVTHQELRKRTLDANELRLSLLANQGKLDALARAIQLASQTQFRLPIGLDLVKRLLENGAASEHVIREALAPFSNGWVGQWHDGVKAHKPGHQHWYPMESVPEPLPAPPHSSEHHTVEQRIIEPYAIEQRAVERCDGTITGAQYAWVGGVGLNIIYRDCQGRPHLLGHVVRYGDNGETYFAPHAGLALRRGIIVWIVEEGFYLERVVTPNPNDTSDGSEVYQVREYRRQSAPALESSQALSPDEAYRPAGYVDYRRPGFKTSLSPAPAM